MSRSNINILAETLGYAFQDIALLSCALTHKSARKKKELEHGINYERLEFLGDAVLSLVAADFLYAQKQHFTEGDLSRLRAQYVCQDNLSKAAEQLQLGAYIRSERTLRSAAVLSDAVEALFGAVFIDGGLEAARQVIFHVLGEPSTKLKLIEKDAKTKLQEQIQASLHQAPKYVVLDKQGPAHAPTYVIGVKIDGEVVASASGEYMKTAAQNAAVQALEILKHERDS
jgi:ribonuclease-3